MPVIRPHRMRRTEVPDTISALIAGEPIEYSREAKRALVDAVYLGPATGLPRLPEAAERRAVSLLARWDG